MTKSKTIGHLKLGFNLTFACLPARQGFWNLSFRSVRSSRCRSGQSTAEFGIVIFVLAAALIASQVYIKRGIQGKLKSGADSIGDQYDPANTTSDYLVTQQSSIETRSTSDITQVGVVDPVPIPPTPGGPIVPPPWTPRPSGGVDITTSTSETTTVYSNVLKTGYERILNP